jgi:hypothetical protein
VTRIAVAVALCSAVAAAAPVAAALSGLPAAPEIAPAELRPEGLQDRLLDHAGAPQQQGDAADQVQEDRVPSHLIRLSGHRQYGEQTINRPPIAAGCNAGRPASVA